jgi:hypothetical protein
VEAYGEASFALLEDLLGAENLDTWEAWDEVSDFVLLELLVLLALLVERAVAEDF